MPITIKTGSDLCQVIIFTECPACGRQYDMATGKWKLVWSVTLGDKVFVCDRHSPDTGFSAEEEIRIQESVERAYKSKNGRVSRDGKKVKFKKGLVHGH